MENKKPTKKELFAQLRELAEDAERQDLIDFVDHEVELLNKKTTNKKPTKEQQANALLKDEIVETLNTIGTAVTISELFTKAPVLAEKLGGSNQKASALLKQLYDPKYNDVRVERIVDKKRTLFKAI